MDIKIVDLVRDAETGCVITVYWEASLTKNKKTAKYKNHIKLSFKEPSDPTFIKFNKLTESKVLEWLNERITAQQFNEIEQYLNKQLNNTPVSISLSGIPWNK